MGKIFRCNACNRVHRNEPVYTYCGYCHEEFMSIVRLYNRALQQVARIRDYSVSEYVARMWNRLESVLKAESRP